MTLNPLTTNTTDTVLSDLIASQGCVIADGAMGTQLFAAGLDSGNPPEAWNVDHPTKIQAVHQAYLQAGSDMILTNSFGGNSFRLKLHDLHNKTLELNEAAAHNARKAADEESERNGRPVLVAGSMGPTGELLSPLGEMTVSACEEAYARQAEGLAAGGVDLLWVETMSDLDEVMAAVSGARMASILPVAVTMSFDTVGRTMMGVTGQMTIQRLKELDLVAVGANCGNQLADTEAAVVQMIASLGREKSEDETSNGGSSASIAVIVKANAGIPEWKRTAMVYNGSPEMMAASAHRMLSAGATIIGGCCGTTPEHVRKISSVLKGGEPVPDIPAPISTSTSSESTTTTRRRQRRRQRTQNNNL